VNTSAQGPLAPALQAAAWPCHLLRAPLHLPLRWHILPSYADSSLCPHCSFCDLDMTMATESGTPSWVGCDLLLEDAEEEYRWGSMVGQEESWGRYTRCKLVGRVGSRQLKHGSRWQRVHRPAMSAHFHWRLQGSARQIPAVPSARASPQP